MKQEKKVTCSNVRLSRDAQQQLKDLLLELINHSDMNAIASDFLGLSEYSEQDMYCEDGYSYYTRNIELSDDQYSDIAAAFIKHVFQRGDISQIVKTMAENVDVLLDEELSARWLLPYVMAERTSIAYERGKRLVDYYQDYRSAERIMREAADRGDAFCAMYLIENTLCGELFGFRSNDAFRVTREGRDE